MVTALQNLHRVSVEAVLILLRMHGIDGGMGWMFLLIMILFWILILLALAGGVYWLFSRLFGGNSTHSSARETRAENPSEEALSILNERYARGEIDDEEYRNRKRNIQEREE